MIDVTDHRRRDVKWTLIHGNWHKEVTINELMYETMRTVEHSIGYLSKEFGTKTRTGSTISTTIEFKMR